MFVGGAGGQRLLHEADGELDGQIGGQLRIRMGDVLAEAQDEAREALDRAAPERHARLVEAAVVAHARRERHQQPAPRAVDVDQEMQAGPQQIGELGVLPELRLDHREALLATLCLLTGRRMS